MEEHKEENKYKHYIYNVSQSGFAHVQGHPCCCIQTGIFLDQSLVSNIYNISTWAEHLCTHQFFVSLL